MLDFLDELWHEFECRSCGVGKGHPHRPDCALKKLYVLVLGVNKLQVEMDKALLRWKVPIKIRIQLSQWITKLSEMS